MVVQKCTNRAQTGGWKPTCEDFSTLDVEGCIDSWTRDIDVWPLMSFQRVEVQLPLAY